MSQKIYICRGGAPDKFNYNGVNSNIEYLKLDHKNLIDLDIDFINDIINQDNYIVSAYEEDIYKSHDIDSDHIIIPDLINPDYIHKDSSLYKDLANYGLKYWIYPKFLTMNNSSNYELDNKVIKCTKGSGSREVYVDDNDLAESIGYPFVSGIEYWMVDRLLKIAQDTDCRVMIQDKIPNLLDKVKATLNIVFRDGDVLGYVWTEVPDKKRLTTNWDRGYHVRSEFTDFAVAELSNFLSDFVTRGIVNVDFHIDYENKICYITEFNWRIGNNFFESTAANICLLEQYVKNELFSIEFGKHEFVRYWQCQYIKNNHLYS